MSTAFAIISFLILLPLVVIAHELGHFLFARWRGVKVQAFSIGFGKPIFKWMDRRGTEWRVGWIPLGGYVALYGQSDLPEKPEEADKYLKALTPEKRRGHFEFASRWVRAQIIFGGPLFSYLFGFIIFFGLFLFSGVPGNETIIQSVEPNTPAYVAGLQAGDRIVSVGGRELSKRVHLPEEVARAGGEELSISIIRDGAELAVLATPVDGRLGVAFMASQEERRPAGVIGAGREALADVWFISSRTSVAIFEMLTGTRDAGELGGLLTIAEVSGEALRLGAFQFLYIVGLISVTLGLFNLLPIPFLDGGHLIVMGIEAVRRRDFSMKTKARIITVGFWLVMALMVLANFNDVTRLFR